MYIPKLMLCIFNAILLIMGLIALHRGLSDNYPIKLKPLENESDVRYFPKVMLFGGIAEVLVSILGFWGAEMDSRTALITYRIFLIFLLSGELVILSYCAFNRDTIKDQLSMQFSYWRDEYQQTGHQLQLENIQRTLDCCELNSTDCINPNAPPCTEAAFNYFTSRNEVHVWLITQIILPEVAALMFSAMVTRKIWILQSILLGKLGSAS